MLEGVGGNLLPEGNIRGSLFGTLFRLFGWNTDLKYRVSGELYQEGKEIVYIFNITDAEAFIKPCMLAAQTGQSVYKAAARPLSVSGKRVRAVPEEWTSSFGSQYYLHQHIFPPVEEQSENDWKIRLEGQLFETGERLHVTGFDELKQFISQELSKGAKEVIVNE